MEATTVRLLGKKTLVLDGLTRMLTANGFVVACQVERVASAADYLGETDILLLTDNDRGLYDFSAVTMLHERFPALKLVMLSDTFEASAVMAAFEAGVSGYLTKDLAQDPLIGSLRLIAMGEKVLPSRLMESLPSKAHATQERIDFDDKHLSNREREILKFLVGGLSNKLISKKLAISEATVKVHVKAILRKLGVKNRTQAAMQAFNGGLTHHGLKMHLIAAMGALELVMIGLPPLV